jgi:hypothetical protein
VRVTPRIRRALCLAGLLAWLAAPGAGAAELSCEQAAGIAETALALPAGLLLAIGQVESGRSQAAGLRAPWPWTVQGGGAGRFFASAAAAMQAVQGLRATGVQSIDIGCFQVNLLYHPDAFADLASGFDPLGNALAAARFLAALHAELGSWEAAVAAYHSRSDAPGGAYRDAVFAAWRGGAAPVVGAGWQGGIGLAAAPLRVGIVHVWGPPGAPLAAAAVGHARLPRVIVPAQP